MKKKILVRGPVLSQSGYGEQARFALRALKSREDLFDVFILPIAWGNTGWIWKDDELRQWMDEKITLTHLLIHKKQLQIEVSFRHCIFRRGVVTQLFSAQYHPSFFPIFSLLPLFI